MELPLIGNDLRAINRQTEGRDVEVTLAESTGAAREFAHDGTVATWVDAESGERRTAPAAALQQVKWLSANNARGRGLLEGAGIGALIGLAGGALIGAAAWKPCTDCWGGFNRGFAAASYGLFGAATGLLVGAFVGASVGHHDAVEFTPP